MINLFPMPMSRFWADVGRCLDLRQKMWRGRRAIVGYKLTLGSVFSLTPTESVTYNFSFPIPFLNIAADDCIVVFPSSNPYSISNPSSSPFSIKQKKLPCP